MGAVPDSIRRNFDGQRRSHEDPSEYPAGGRKAWERRQVGLDDVPDEEQPSGLATGRTNYERAKAERRGVNVEEDEDAPYPTGSRSSYETRMNAMDDGEAQPWLDHEYPLTAKRRMDEEREKEQRREELQEQIKRNEARSKLREREPDE